MSTQKCDSIEILIKHSLAVQENEIPDDVMSKTQELFQDTLACILAGSSSDGIKSLLDTVQLWGGHEQATILGFSEQTSVPFAAMINSAMGHARDFDDTHDKAVNHGCVTLVPAILVLAEFLSSPTNTEKYKDHDILFRKISGREFLASLAVGLDVANRIGTAFIAYLHTGWLPTTLWGAFGCVAAGARLLKMDEKQTRDAFGLAYSQAQGNRQALVDGALAKRMQPGFCSYAGVQSLFMALNGISGSRNILQGVFGISELYADSNIDIECITNNLGSSFETSNISIKPYPSCRCTHAVIDAALKIKKEHEFKVSDIVSGEISLPPVSMGQIGNLFKIRKNPTVDAQFSAQYTAALSFIKGEPALNDFEPEVISSADNVISLASLFKTVEFRHDSREMTPIEMKIKLKDARILEAGITNALGSPTNPLSQEDLLFKFNDCLDNCIKQYTPKQKDALLNITQNILDIDDISKLFKYL
ncbi:MAG: MmgE/PrpD family protein [Victivallaceae bacterium]|nr:MmgE/PrpD family protein [Victivallaceae bacterium]